MKASLLTVRGEDSRQARAAVVPGDGAVAASRLLGVVLSLAPALTCAPVPAANPVHGVGDEDVGLSTSEDSRRGNSRSPGAAEWMTVFADERWYASQAGEERVFRGVLEAVPARGAVSGGRRTGYYKLANRTLYTGARRLDALDRLVGSEVVVRGKAVFMVLEGAPVQEIWPAAVRRAR